jgi:hypothetical protein
MIHVLVHANCIQEVAENVIQVTEFDAATLDRMLEFMYLGDYRAESTAHLGIKTAVEYQNNILNPEYIDDLEDKTSSIPIPDFSEWMVDTEYKASTLLAMLEPHIGVNSIADYYDVQPLKDRAQAMIFYVLRTSWSARGFLSAVGEVYETTADKSLHGIMASAAIEHLQELIGTKEFAEMDMPSVFAVEVIRRAGERLKDAEDSLQYARTQSENHWNWTCRTTPGGFKETWDLRETNERLNAAINKLEANANCSHCSAGFNGVVREKHREGRPSIYLVRCRRCGTKH